MLKDWVAIAGGEDHPAELEFVESYWTEAFRKQVGGAGLEQSVRGRDEYRIMSRYLSGLQPGARILDGGCGRGEWTVFLAGKGYDVTGLDISRELVEKLRELFPDRAFDRGDIRDTGYGDGAFDVYFSWGAFEHFEEGLGPCLREAHRILKEGGHLLFSVPFANARHVRSRARAAAGGPRGGGESPRVRFYQWRFTAAEVAAALGEAGFRVLDVVPIHKDEGLRRMLRHDLHWAPEAGGLLESAALRLGRALVPAGYVSHMLMGIGRKG